MGWVYPKHICTAPSNITWTNTIMFYILYQCAFNHDTCASWLVHYCAWAVTSVCLDKIHLSLLRNHTPKLWQGSPCTNIMS